MFALIALTLDVKIVYIAFHDGDFLPSTRFFQGAVHGIQLVHHVEQLLVAKEDGFLVLGVQGALVLIINLTLDALDLNKERSMSRVPQADRKSQQ